MKRILLQSVIAFSSLTISVSAAAQCKYVKEQTDPFTKITTRTAQMAIGFGLAGWEVFLQQKGTKYLLGIRAVYSGKVDKPYKKGDNVFFMLSNGSTIELVTTKDYEPLPVTMYDAPYTQWMVLEEVPVETFKKFGEAKITNLKTHVGEHDFLLPKINDRQTTKIMETVTCMLSGN